MASTVFSPCDSVVWNPTGPIRFDNRAMHPKWQHGEGPFTVVTVEAVPTICGCPYTYETLSEHLERCPVATQETVGHSQWITLRKPSGEIPKDSITQQPVRFSGAWFVKA
jgi:hypothetical protein